MLSKLGNVLQGAADLVAPPCSRVQDLEFHWRQVHQSCQRKNKESKLVAVEETHIPKHLKEIVKILLEDCTQLGESKILSPCLEYIIQENVLMALCSYAQDDKPLGIRQYTFGVFTNILQFIPNEYLHQMKIHKAIQILINVSSEKKASPYENQEIDLICTLCDKIQDNPDLALLYVSPDVLTFCESEEKPNVSGESNSKFPLMDSILHLCHSSDSRINDRSHQCLLTILKLGIEPVSSVISKHSLLPQYLSNRLIVAAESIPLDTEESLIESIATKHRLRNNLASLEDVEPDVEGLDQQMIGEADIEKLFQWVLFCDKILKDCDEVLSTEISFCIRELFLNEFIKSMFITKDSEDVAGLFTSLVTNILLLASSKCFIDCIVLWILEDYPEDTQSLRHLLLQKCRQPSTHLQLLSLRLVQTMLEHGNGHAAQILVLEYVSNRAYVDNSPTEQNQTSWSDEEDERYKARESARFSLSHDVMIPDSTTAIPDSLSRTLAPANIAKIINRLLGVVGDEIRSTSTDEFEAYQANAIRQYKQVCKKVPMHLWPREAVNAEVQSETSSTASKESQAESEATYFNEGPLISLLLDFLENLPNQDYDVNLQVTSLISSLALLPHPFLHEFLLNPYLSLSPGARTPYTILSKVVEEIRPSIVSKKDYKNYLKLTRFQLLGTMEDLEFVRIEDNSKFEALVVIEEFIKELASIAYAKYVCELENCK